MYVQEDRPQAVVVTETAAAADLVVATLAAHGVRASTAAYSIVYPSVDWVEGFRVAVPPDEVERALEVLRGLSGRSDVGVLSDEERTSSTD